MEKGRMSRRKSQTIDLAMDTNVDAPRRQRSWASIVTRCKITRRSRGSQPRDESKRRIGEGTSGKIAGRGEGGTRRSVPSLFLRFPRPPPSSGRETAEHRSTLSNHRHYVWKSRPRVDSIVVVVGESSCQNPLHFACISLNDPRRSVYSPIHTVHGVSLLLATRVQILDRSPWFPVDTIVRRVAQSRDANSGTKLHRRLRKWSLHFWSLRGVPRINFDQTRHFSSV